MKKILVTGALGQLGTELVPYLRKAYGEENVVATDLRQENDFGLYEVLDATDGKRMGEIIDKYQIDTVMHLAALLSAVGEKNPGLLWNVNMNGLYTVLELAREKNLALFTPSSIAAFGPETPADNTPQVTIQRPSTLYGVSKVAGELLCDYYNKKFGVDARGVRYPGLISYVALPGGGTTDYAVHIYYDALQKGAYTSYIGAGTNMDMLYMPDALDAIKMLMEANPEKLKHRNAYNVTAMAFDPEVQAASIRKVLPDFKLSYEIDPVRQKIAESWPNSLDDSAAREDWGWNPKYDLDAMTVHMLEQLRIKLGVK